MNELIKLATKLAAKPAVQRVIQSAGEKAVEVIKEHGAELIENIGHLFGM